MGALPCVTYHRMKHASVMSTCSHHAPQLHRFMHALCTNAIVRSSNKLGRKGRSQEYASHHMLNGIQRMANAAKGFPTLEVTSTRFTVRQLVSAS